MPTKQGRQMAFTDTFARQVRHKGSRNGEKYSDGAGL